MIKIFNIIFSSKFKLAILTIVILTSCVTDSNYKTLSFFFDGVQNPKDDSVSIKIINRKDTLTKKVDIKPVQTEFIHLPYAEKSCKDCHEFGTKMVVKIPEPDLCYQCHNDLSKEYKVLHGPVAGGYCTSCHNPHSSKFAKLLVKENNSSLCFNCHVKEDVLKNEVHSEGMNCVDCHNPHGGNDQYLQK
jgi:predicted CXXCH cytochrome family protein